jgi:membrane associated rhomboid family serine protease
MDYFNHRNNPSFLPFRLFPPVVKNILIITCITFLAQTILPYTLNIALDDYLGLHYFGGDLFKPHQFITYIFLHGGFAHLFFNMFAVWMFGAALENYWGSKNFLIFYLLTGLGAALVQFGVFYYETKDLFMLINEYKLNPSQSLYNAIIETGHFSSNNISGSISTEELKQAAEFFNNAIGSISDRMVVIGASGSLFGLLGAYGIIFPNNIINIYGIIPIKAKYLVIIYGALELFSGIQNRPGDNVAHFAHLGGLAVGILLILLWRKRF